MFFGDHFLANPPFLTKSGRIFNVYGFGFPETATGVYNFPRSFFVSSRKTPVTEPMNSRPAAIAQAVSSVSLAVSAKESSECSRIASML